MRRGILEIEPQSPDRCLHSHGPSLKRQYGCSGQATDEGVEWGVPLPHHQNTISLRDSSTNCDGTTNSSRPFSSASVSFFHAACTHTLRACSKTGETAAREGATSRNRPPWSRRCSPAARPKMLICRDLGQNARPGDVFFYLDDFQNGHQCIGLIFRACHVVVETRGRDPQMAAPRDNPETDRPG